MNKLHIKVRNCRTCLKSKKTNKVHISINKRLFCYEFGKCSSDGCM